MNQVNQKRLLEVMVYPTDERKYQLDVEDGKPIRIIWSTPSEYTISYPEDNMFGLKYEIIITTLSQYENLENLKKLYNVLEDGYWKELVSKSINNRIEYFEKGLTILKS